ncbi:MAG: hypothetical protein K0R44_1560 [Thermomicrobiales bacterium]|nr:hypothetical protein [Thermomicrobiales bacterium]
MSFFGSSRGKPSFFSDPMFAGLDMSGFDPSGLQNAIDENAAAPKPKRNFGDSTLGAIIGILGDGALGFVGQPAVYGPSIAEGRQRQQKMMEEYEKRQRERAEGREEDTKWEWENKPKDPYMPPSEKEAQYYESIGDHQRAADTRAKASLVPVQQADPNTGEVRYQYVRPTTLMGGGSQPAAPATDLPRISTPGEAAKLPPGSWFIAPDGSRRQVPGGAGPGAPRTFP